MQPKIQHNISHNKRDYPTFYSFYQLTCDEIFHVSKYYKKKKNIQLYVQTYLNDFIQESNNALDNMRKIQEKLTEQDSVGYLHTNSAHGMNKVHIECFIITKSQIIKPVRWNISSGGGGIYIEGEDGFASTALNIFSLSTLIPQADGYTCASLSLVYLKQLLQENAKQLKELTISIPCFLDSARSKLTYFFVPSPQVLRYSQSTEYNQCLKSMVIEDEPGKFAHKEKISYFTTLKHELQNTIVKADELKLTHIKTEAQELLQKLPAFRERWKASFEQIELKRNLMTRQGRNVGLAYTSKRMRKIAIIEKTQDHTLGVTLLQEISNKKSSEALTDKSLLDFFSNYFLELKFNHDFQFGYFLNKLCKIVDSKILYPWLFEFEHHFSLINDPTKYTDTSFLLDTEVRHNLRDYMKKRFKDKTMFDGCSKDKNSDPYSILLWANALNITSKQDMLNFLQERVEQEIFAPQLIKNLASYNYAFWSLLFEEEKDLAEFLWEYIGGEKLLISLLPDLFNDSQCSSISMIFSSKDDFYSFIEKNMPLDRVLSSLQDMQWKIFRLRIESYIMNCIPVAKCSALIIKELDNLSSILYKKFKEDPDHPRLILLYLDQYCNAQDIEFYLKKHRLCLLEEIIKRCCFAQMNLKKQLYQVALKINFFSIDNASILNCYQKAIWLCIPDKQTECLREILQFIPEEEKREFIEQIFTQEDENCIKHIIIPEEIRKLIPKKKPEIEIINQNNEPVSSKSIIARTNINLNHFGQIDIGAGKDLAKQEESRPVYVVNEESKAKQILEQNAVNSEPPAIKSNFLLEIISNYQKTSIAMATVLVVGGLAALALGVFMITTPLIIAGGVSSMLGAVLSYGIFSVREDNNLKKFEINSSPVLGNI